MTRLLIIFILTSSTAYGQMFGHVYTKGQVQAKNIKNASIYVEIGDSNAGGPILESGSFPTIYQSSTRVKIYYKPTVTSTDDGYWQYYDTRSNPINRRPGLITGSYAVGADQAFVYGLTNSTLGKELRFFKLGIGGSTLLAQAGSDNDWSTTSLELFQSFYKNFVKIGVDKLAQEGFRDPMMKAVIVRLGTNDCKISNWNQANFVAAIPIFVTAIRAQTGFANVPIYWVLPKSDLPSASTGEWNSTNVNQCRTAISNCISGGSTQIANFFTLNYDALTTADGIHYDENSFITIGASEAAIMTTNIKD